MKYYAACAGYTGNPDIASAIVYPPMRVLLSFYYYKKKGDLVKKLLRSGVEVLIDSGAFTAHNSGKTVDINEYCKFIYDTGVSQYAGLDVIGDSKATMINQKYMESVGLSPIPTFHMGSTIDEVEPLLEYGRIAFGGMVFNKGLRNHMDILWSHILKRKPNIKIHGFWVTNLEFMARYPWDSIDSSNFQACRRWGDQHMLWNGLKFRKFSAKEFYNLLRDHYLYPSHVLDDLKNIRYLEYLFSVNSYKMYAEHLNEINKHKKFEYLTSQGDLFDKQ